MKQSTVSVLPPFSQSFSKQVTTLAAEAKDLQKSYKTLTERMLRFAERFHALWEEAHRLDGNKDKGQHTAHFRSVLGTVVNTNNASIWSRWNTIGKYAEDLKPHVDSLPPQRDALYELALATKQGKRVERWIEQDKLSPESSVRDVQALCKKKARTPSAQQTPKHLAAVTLYFHSYGDAAQCLSGLLIKEPDITVSSHEAFKHAVQELLKDTYEQVAPRIK